MVWSSFPRLPPHSIPARLWFIRRDEREAGVFFAGIQGFHEWMPARYARTIMDVPVILCKQPRDRLIVAVQEPVNERIHECEKEGRQKENLKDYPAHRIRDIRHAA